MRVRASSVTLLVAAGAVSLGAALYAQALVTSLDRAVQVKAYVATGSDVQGVVNFDQRLPPRLGVPITKVALDHAGATLGSARGPQVDLMAIDPRTFARAAHWEPSWGSLPDLMGKLTASGDDGLPVIVAGGAVPPQQISFGGRSFPVRAIASLPSFPGAGAARPLVVTTFAALAQATKQADVANPLR